MTRPSAGSRFTSAEALEETFREDPQFFADGQTYFAAEDVVPAFGDFLEELAVDVDQHPQSRPAVLAGVARVGDLADGLRSADVVSLHVDLNAQTRNFMGEREFALMKTTAILVNTSRGGVVDQVALARALTVGEIAGAGLDVLREEPPRPDDPILRAPNAIIVPHIGSATVETRHAMARRAVDNLVQGLRRAT